MGLSLLSGLSAGPGLTETQGVSIGDGLSFQQFTPVVENYILLENKTDDLTLEDGVSILLQEA